MGDTCPACGCKETEAVEDGEVMCLDCGEVWSKDAADSTESLFKVGVIQSADKVAGKDKLTALKVDVGAADPVTVVTNAPNVKEGNRIVLALVGATIGDADDGEKVTKSTIGGAHNRWHAACSCTAKKRRKTAFDERQVSECPGLCSRKFTSSTSKVLEDLTASLPVASIDQRIGQPVTSTIRPRANQACPVLRHIYRAQRLPFATKEPHLSGVPVACVVAEASVTRRATMLPRLVPLLCLAVIAAAPAAKAKTGHYSKIYMEEEPVEEEEELEECEEEVATFCCSCDYVLETTELDMYSQAIYDEMCTTCIYTCEAEEEEEEPEETEVYKVYYKEPEYEEEEEVEPVEEVEYEPVEYEKEHKKKVYKVKEPEYEHKKEKKVEHEPEYKVYKYKEPKYKYEKKEHEPKYKVVYKYKEPKYEHKKEYKKEPKYKYEKEEYEPVYKKVYKKEPKYEKEYEKKEYVKKDYEKKEPKDEKEHEKKEYVKEDYDYKEYKKKEYKKDPKYEKKDYDYEKKDYEKKDYDKKDYDKKDYEKKDYEKDDY